MIIGHGSLAKLIQDREGAIFFCAGVSHNKPTDEECIREANSLNILSDSKDCLFYFSSIMAPITCSKYYNHKTEMENYITAVFTNYNIIRLGNVWECTNPNTFINYLKAHPEAKVRENEMKFMISAKQLNIICQSLPLIGKNEISVFGEMLTVKECLSR